MGLLLDSRDGVYDADVRFVGGQAKVIKNYVQGKQDTVTGQQVSFGTAVHAMASGGLIGFFAVIKTLPNVVENVVKETKTQIETQIKLQP